MGKYESSGDNGVSKNDKARSGRSAKQNGRKKRGKQRYILPIILVSVLACFMIGLINSVVKPPPVNPGGDDLPSISNTPKNPNPGNPSEPQPDPAPKGKVRKPQGEYYTVLVVGTNDDYNTDTIMLCSIDVKNLKVNVASIPRDTMIDTTAKIKRINGAYGRVGIRDKEAGQNEGLCEEVEVLTGVPIDKYVVINVESFTKIVDAIGGVEFDVPYNMYHADKDMSQTINLKKGPQTLNGKKALQLVRYRSTSQSDFERMRVQRDFLLATAKQVVSKFTVDKIIEIIGVINESVKTDMPLNNMIWFYNNLVAKLDFDQDIEFLQMPVEATGKYNKQDYVYLDKQGVLDLVNEKLNPFTTELTLDDLHIIRKEN